MRIGIVGAGIGGLAAALGLLRRGFEVAVYEQAKELREVGAGLQVSSNGACVLHDLGVLDEIHSRSFTPAGKEIRLWNTGQMWKLFDLGVESVERYGFPYFTAHRNDLHEVLVKAIRALAPNAIRLDHKCVGFEQNGEDVELHFTDKTSTRHDVVVGADGVHSVLREGLFGMLKAEFTGMIAWRGVIPIERLPERLVRDVGTNWVGPGGHVIHYPIRRGELMNFTSVVENQEWKVESWSSPSTVEAYLADYPGWHEDVHTFIRAIDVPYRWALLSRKPIPNWTIGRVTLLGDAAHPMLPFLAQGAVMALEDALLLARAMEAYNDPVEALQRYTKARIGRASKVVEGAAANAGRFHNTVLADNTAAHAYVDKEWDSSRVAERYEWLFRYNAQTAPV